MEKLLKQTGVTPHEIPRYNRVLGNWVCLSKQLKNYEEVDLLKLLKLELTGRKRLDIIQRIYGRFNQLRKWRERKIMLKVLARGL